MAEKIAGMIHEQEVPPEFIKLDLERLKAAVTVVDPFHSLVDNIQFKIKTIGA
jgi:hypothetical protein